MGQKESSDADAQGEMSGFADGQAEQYPERGQQNYDTNWSIQDMDAAGLDSSILSKLAHVQEVCNATS